MVLNEMQIGTTIQKATTWIAAHKREVITAAVVVVVLIFIWRASKKDKNKQQNPSLGSCENFTNLTYPDANYSNWAEQLNSLFRTGLFGSTEDDGGIADILMKMQTTDDVQKLICAFGLQPKSTVFGWNLEYWTLTEAIMLLDSGNKSQVNADYKDKGITFTW